MKRFFFINLTKLCNLNCDHCCVTMDNRKNNNKIIDIDKVISLLNDNYFSNDELKVIWQGGEPTLIGDDKFLDIVSRVKNETHASQTMVTNLYDINDNIIYIIKNFFDGKIDTTFAYEGKYDWNLNQEKYLNKFQNNFIKLKKSGVEVFANLELNKKTLLVGPQKLKDFFEHIGKTSNSKVLIDIDYSLNYDDYFNNRKINKYDYPILITQNTHNEVSTYLKELYNITKDNKWISINLFKEIGENKKIETFSVCMDDKFITLNPDGFVTTNPLFIDIPETFIGNFYIDDVKTIIGSKQRIKRNLFEENRMLECINCDEYEFCYGSSSYVPIWDEDMSECAGYKSLRKHIKNSSKLQK